MFECQSETIGVSWRFGNGTAQKQRKSTDNYMETVSLIWCVRQAVDSLDHKDQNLWASLSSWPQFRKGWSSYTPLLWVTKVGWKMEGKRTQWKSITSMGNTSPNIYDLWAHHSNWWVNWTRILSVGQKPVPDRGRGRQRINVWVGGEVGFPWNLIFCYKRFENHVKGNLKIECEPSWKIVKYLLILLHKILLTIPR